jgi:hypothetical protein
MPTDSALRVCSFYTLLCLFLVAVPGPITPLMAQGMSTVADTGKTTGNPSIARVLPDQTITTVNGRVFPPPLTGKERWDRYVKATFTSGSIYFAAFGAALGDQVNNNPKEWGRNWGGYFKRAGTMYATFAIQNSIYQAGSAALHNEGRYIPCQCEGGWHRAGYALQMTFLTYHNGHKVLDISQFAGAYGSGMIPILWYPAGYSPTVQGVQNGHAQMGFVLLVREIQEFAPELKRFFRHLKP